MSSLPLVLEKERSLPQNLQNPTFPFRVAQNRVFKGGDWDRARGLRSPQLPACRDARESSVSSLLYG